MTSLFKDFLSITVILTLLLSTSLSFSATGPYYYLHVASFQTEKKAIQSVKNFQRYGLSTVVNKEYVPKKGAWYRIYIGPFSSQQEAKLKAAELKNEGIIDYAAVKKKDSMITGTVAAGVPIVTEKSTVAVQQPPPAVKISKPPPPTQQKTISKAARPSIQKKAAKEPIAPAAPKKKTRKVKRKPPKPVIKEGKGRNVPGGSVAVGYKHTYTEINTELTERLKIETNGGTTITPVPIEDIKNDFPLTMHRDTLYLRLGLTDYFEVFAEGGIAYDELSNSRYLVGGGLRLNLFQTADYSMIPGLYAALHGEYLTGEFEEEFDSIAGNKFESETEWQELSAGLEIGIHRPRFTAYIGGNYFQYSEDTDRRQLENLPLGTTSLVLQDELEQENEFGVFGGITVNLTTALSLNIEGRVIDQESISGALEYRF